jgi:hypothetical protein
MNSSTVCWGRGRRPLPLASTMELRAGAGRGCAGLVELALSASATRSVLSNPPIEMAWLEALFDAVLRVVDHSYRE